MRRMLLPYLVLLLQPIASGADTFDDGQIHDVDFPLSGGTSFVRDSTGGMFTTVNLIAGATGFEIEAEDSSVLNVFAGAEIDFPDYEHSSGGAICGGTIRQLDVATSGTVEVNGGSFTNGPSQPVRMTAGTLIVQGGSFENTAGLATKVALTLVAFGGTAELRGGTVVDGALAIGAGTVTISGGNLGSDGMTHLAGGTLTIVGTSFNLPFGPVSAGIVFNGTVSGTLADGSPIDLNILKNPSSNLFLVSGTQGPLTSTVCGAVPTNVPALPTWAIGLGLMSLAATGAVLVRRPHSAY